MVLTYILIGAAIIAFIVLLALVRSKKAAPQRPPTPQRLPRADAAPTISTTATTRTTQAERQPAQRPPVEVQSPPVVSPEEAKLDELTKLVGYDRARAERHVARVERSNPDKSRLWCIEKAIEDALRDRHAR
ncbi:MAG TPA: hypothetical protein VGV59_11115 [Pyrinomonadaceae bacterium]|nr:hypothetical protein [Pyrinomonadaceae bacterium]